MMRHPVIGKDKSPFGVIPGYEMSTATWSRPKPHGTKGACVNIRPRGVPQVRVKKYLKR